MTCIIVLILIIIISSNGQSFCNELDEQYDGLGMLGMICICVILSFLILTLLKDLNKGFVDMDTKEKNINGEE